MKRFFLITAGAFTIIGASCNNGQSKDVPTGQLSAKMIHNPRSAEGMDPAQVKDLPVLTFTDTNYNFGWMGDGEKVEHEFTFKNEGKSPLIVAGANSSCGCTIPEFSREPIPPGSTGILKVTFSSAGKEGHVLKSVTVSSNAYPAVKVLTITADIKPKSK